MSAKSVDRVAEAAAQLGLGIEIRTTPESTRTAAEAAAACECAEAQIVKSLIFELEGTAKLVLLLAPGDRQVDLGRAAAATGAPLKRADAKRVRAETGFAIGGVSPLGHLLPIDVFMDARLLEHDVVWAAAGAPNAVFSIAPTTLREAVGARLAEFTN